MKKTLLGLGCALLVCLLAGCSKPGPKVVSASGVVTLNGNPIEGAVVMFHPQGGGARSSHGTTNAQGEFKMSTFGLNDGALPGKHVVTIAKVERPAEAEFDPQKLKTQGYSGQAGYGEMMGTVKGKSTKPEYIIPEKYTDQKQSGLEVDVVEGEKNEFTFNLE